MAINKDTVEYAANLSRIDMADNELEKLSRQIQDIVNYIDKLKALDTADIEPTSHILPISNILREDIAAASLPIEKILKNAPAKKGNFFSVPKVIE
ncbi:MAG: Asp-tRNA(Asn)/Glu-tRNA(Gln) amidotransferase subunit GatC [Candidatus Omnitrophota bacterium]